MQQSNHYSLLSSNMIPLLLLGLTSLSSLVVSSDDSIGKWKVVDGSNGQTCIMMYATIDLRLNYIKQDDSLADVDMFSVPADATTTKSSCNEKVQIGDEYIESQVLHLEFPNNEGWNVRLAFTQDPRMGVKEGEYTLWQVNVTANYSSMPELFVDAPKDHTHTYFSVISFTDPPEIATIEYTKEGDSLYCPSPQGFIINQDAANGPSAFVRLSNLQMQAYMTSDEFGKQATCADDQNDIDLVPMIVSAVLALIVLLTLIAYFVYRSRLPTDIIDTIQPEFEDAKEHDSLNVHDNYGYQEEDHRF